MKKKMIFGVFGVALLIGLVIVVSSALSKDIDRGMETARKNYSGQAENIATTIPSEQAITTEEPVVEDKQSEVPEQEPEVLVQTEEEEPVVQSTVAPNIIHISGREAIDLINSATYDGIPLDDNQRASLQEWGFYYGTYGDDDSDGYVYAYNPLGLSRGAITDITFRNDSYWSNIPYEDYDDDMFYVITDSKSFPYILQGILMNYKYNGWSGERSLKFDRLFDYGRMGYFQNVKSVMVESTDFTNDCDSCTAKCTVSTNGVLKEIECYVEFDDEGAIKELLVREVD